MNKRLVGYAFVPEVKCSLCEGRFRLTVIASNKALMKPRDGHSDCKTLANMGFCSFHPACRGRASYRRGSLEMARRGFTEIAQREREPAPDYGVCILKGKCGVLFFWFPLECVMSLLVVMPTSTIGFHWTWVWSC